MSFTIGTGIDVHGYAHEVSTSNCPDVQYSAGNCLKLGLLEFPDFPQLQGHSDADVATHALCGAILSAAHLGDIGSLLGVDDENWKGASGEKVLQHVLETVQHEGFSLESASIQIVARAPKIHACRNQMVAKYQEVTGIRIGIGATTTDGFLAELGNGQAIMAVANALLRFA
ncbi:MAG: 2-C-methyl-D-erythritol 2,4-cyclodiphosphate synthase [Candidatus Ancillula trichonymphae]|jgi:2-C-methyl-D-erythritol 2,4-cyclodiphosphate synthase|nr:2-C-methyl-D-erythritol 2,4-cyclodiphosphate synthase [Candidatus Ancillula trichonymphae]